MLVPSRPDSPLLPILVTAALVLTAGPLRAAVVVHVPGDQPTIQQGINAASTDDTVRVAPGTYVENLDFFGKSIVLDSEAGPASTILDVNHVGSGVRFASGEGPSSVLTGFTIRNASGYDNYGVRVTDSSPTIRGNVIRDCDSGILLQNSHSLFESNQVFNNPYGGIHIYGGVGGGDPTISGNDIHHNNGGYGGGIDCEGSAATIRGNHIHHNFGQFGGGAYLSSASGAVVERNLFENNFSGNGGGMLLNAGGTPTIRNNVFRNNDAGGGTGGGLHMFNGSSPLVVQNLFVGNHGLSGAGMAFSVPLYERGPRVLNNTFAANDGVYGSAIYANGFDADVEIVGNVMVAPAGQVALYCSSDYDPNGPRVRNNDVFSLSGPAYGGACADKTGLDGNISVDPLFRNAPKNLRLQAGSPCLDVGDDTAGDLPLLDLDGQPRRFDADGDGNAQVDMGAYEFGTANLAPVADAGGPYSGDIDSPFLFDGTGSFDPEEDPLTYAWDFGDGGTGSGSTANHQYAALGTYVVTLTVSDGPHSDSDTTTVEVVQVNKTPVADAGGPYVGLVGQPVQFDGTGSHDPENDPLTYTWYFGDGYTDQGPTPTHTYGYSGTFPVTLEVRDATGVGRDSTTATILYPSADLYTRQSHAPDPVVAGGTLAFAVTVGNLGPLDATDAYMSFTAYGPRFSISTVTSSRGVCIKDTSGCCVSCNFGTLAPNDSVRVDITGTPLEEGVLGSLAGASSPVNDSDYSNNNSYANVTILFSAEQRIGALGAQVVSYGLHRGVTKTLLDRLNDARKALAARDTTSACADLGDFRQRVAKLAGRGLTLLQAITLDSQANEIQSRLGCFDPARAVLASSRPTVSFSFRLRSGLGSTAQAEIDLPDPGGLRLEVFDVNGRLVRSFEQDGLAAGGHVVAWDGRASQGGWAPRGVYFLRATAGAHSGVARFVLLH